MRKVPVESAIINKMHRGFVWSCLGLTAFGGYLLGLRFYRYFTVIRPETKAYEQSLLEHGDSNTTKFNATSDSAPQLKA